MNLDEVSFAIQHTFHVRTVSNFYFGGWMKTCR